MLLPEINKLPKLDVDMTLEIDAVKMKKAIRNKRAIILTNIGEKNPSTCSHLSSISYC